MWYQQASVKQQADHSVCAGEQGSEQDDGLVFLYKLRKGAAPKSYGLQVNSAPPLAV